MIYIIDNFLEKSLFKDLKAFSSSDKIRYTPQYFDNTTEKSDKNTYGFRQKINIKSELVNVLKKTCLEKFKYKINKMHSCGLDKRKLTLFKPHIDDLATVNFYLQIEGQTKLNHGIGFYTDNNLDIHVGFKENRAILFNSTILHTPLVDEEAWRTTLTIFIKEGNFI
jgi:hypothetical protein